ncbi:deoxyguanosine kinase [Priestia megaterium]|uniref:deoxynucleoside kinase n=1 Tax=Priestia megaterium TaxID=1404 RepID=UPI000BF786A0|nr:deoxynucleoside kinase [Priestia megaterium]PFK99866.1 deoxyguanosine kinase [Priestia megaterium]
MTIILVDGVVGVGKTTLAKLLSERFNIPLFEELSNADTEDLLNRFYANKTRWAFTLQIHFLNERFRMIKEIHKKGRGILDRSIFGDNIFAEMLAEDREAGEEGMTYEEYRTYDTLLDNMLEHAQPPDLLIYLECSPEVAKQRIDNRGRGLESTVEMSYWERLNQKYSDWYENYKHSAKVLINVGNLDFANNKEDQESVLAFIGKTLKDIGYIRSSGPETVTYAC